MTNEEWKVGDACVIVTNSDYQRAKVSRLTPTRVMVETKMFDGRKTEEAFQKSTGNKVGHYGWGAPQKIERPSVNSETWFTRRATFGAVKTLSELTNGAIVKAELDQLNTISAVLNDAIAKIAATQGE